MNKKSLVTSCLIGFVFLAVITTFITKPNEEDFVQWLIENYNVKCKDVDCYELTESSETSKGNTFWYSDGNYDTSTGFLNMGMQTKRIYRNIENPNQSFSIEVKGFFGEFKEIEFHQNKVNIKKL